MNGSDPELVPDLPKTFLVRLVLKIHGAGLDAPTVDTLRREDYDGMIAVKDDLEARKCRSRMWSS